MGKGSPSIVTAQLCDLASRIEKLPNLLTAREVMMHLHMGRTTLYGLVARGVIPYLRIGSAIRFDPAKLAAWIRSCEVSELREAA